jgi:EGF-like domain
VLVYSGGATVTVGKVTLKSVKGSTETAVCSNQGLCDTTTGRCNCFPSFSSSDGAGGPGTRKDCGYQLPSLSSYADSKAVVFPWMLSGKGQYPAPLTGTDPEHRSMGPLDLRQYVPINGKKK